MIEIKIETYGCECGYAMDAEVYTKASYFESKGLPQGRCPSCRQHQLSKIVDLSKLTTTKTVEQADIESETKDARNAQGQLVREQIGERYVLNDKTGAIEKRPVEFPKQELLTTTEKQEKLTQAQQTLDRLSKLEHKSS